MGWERDEGAPTSPPVHVQLKPHKSAVLQSKNATMSIETMGGAGRRWLPRPLGHKTPFVREHGCCAVSFEYFCVSQHTCERSHTSSPVCAAVLPRVTHFVTFGVYQRRPGFGSSTVLRFSRAHVHICRFGLIPTPKVTQKEA